MPEHQPALQRELRLWDLVLFNISAVAGVRWLAAAAHAGPGSLTLWLLAAVAFFLPSALVVSSLSARFPQEGGFYIWVKHGFSDWHGFLAAWFYFVSNILFFPGLLLAGVSMASYMFGADAIRYAENPFYTIPVTFIALWAAFLINLIGLRAGKWTAILGGVSTYSVVVLLVAFGLGIALRFGAATSFHLLPKPSWDNLNLWSQIALAMTGLELGAILGGEILNPKKTIPRAAWIGGFACAAFYIAGTAAMLALMPPGKISTLTGLAQAGHTVAQRLNAAWISPCFALLISIGIFGQVGSYIAGNTRLPFAIGLDHYLPPAFAKLHPRWRTPHVSILTQGILSSIFLIAMQLGENVRAAYQMLVDMMVIATLIPFVYIFWTGYRFGQKLAGASGAIISILGVMLSLSPPAGVASVWIFELKVIGGFILFTLLGRWIFVRSKAHAA